MARFIVITKSCPLLTTFFTGKSIGVGERPLSRTDIIEMLTDQRDEVIAKASELGEQQPPSVLVDDLFAEESVAKRSRTRRKASITELLPECLTMRAPSIAGPSGDVAGMEMKVLTKNGPLAIEFTDANMTYLLDAVSAQLSSGGIKRKSNARPAEGRVLAVQAQGLVLRLQGRQRRDALQGLAVVSTASPPTSSLNTNSQNLLLSLIHI